MINESQEFHMPAIPRFSRDLTNSDEFPARRVRRLDYKSSLNRKRTYMKTPDNNVYNFQPKDPRENVSTFMKTLHVPHVKRSKRHGYKLKYDVMFNQTANRPKPPFEIRKGMIIDEREKTPVKRNFSDLNRKELPGDLFLDNLRHQNIDWNAYRKVTWKDILTSYRKDVERTRLPPIQSTRHKDEWLARIEDRVAHTRNEFDTRLPHVSPRLFHPSNVAKRQRAIGSYETKDGLGTIYTLVGPEDYSKREYKPVVYETEAPRVPTPAKLDF